MTEELRRCPWCAEWIQPAAIICRFCQRPVEPVAPSAAEPQPVLTAAELPPAQAEPIATDPDSVSRGKPQPSDEQWQQQLTNDVPMEAVAVDAPPDAGSSEDLSLVGVGGWLGLFAFGCIVSPVVSLYGVITEWNVMRGSDWDRIASAFPRLPFVGGFELAGGLLLSLAFVTLFGALMKSSRGTACLAVVVLSFVIVFATVQLILLYWGFSGSAYRGSVSDELSKQSGGMLRSIVWAIIWLWYFFRSRRVRQTFGPVSWSGAAHWVNRTCRLGRGVP